MSFHDLGMYLAEMLEIYIKNLANFFNTFAYDVVGLNLNKWLDIRILKTWLMYFKFVKCIISIILCYIFFSKGCGESNFLSNY